MIEGSNLTDTREDFTVLIALGVICGFWVDSYGLRRKIVYYYSPTLAYVPIRPLHTAASPRQEQDPQIPEICRGRGGGRRYWHAHRINRFAWGFFL